MRQHNPLSSNSSSHTFFLRLIKIGLMAFACCVSQASFAARLHFIQNRTLVPWGGRLAVTAPGSHAYFTNGGGSSQGELFDFRVNAYSAFFYGFITPDTDKNARKKKSNNPDQNEAYTLTLTALSPTGRTGHGLQFVNKACEFNITANVDPLKPTIRVNQYNGASCEYHVKPGLGESFIVG